MTLVLAWYSKPNSRSVLHLATDSLLSQSGSLHVWPHATKIFRVYPSHSYIAYSGDSHFALSAIAEGIGVLSLTDVLRSETTALKARARALGFHMSKIFAKFPKAWGRSATLLFCGHDPHHGGIHAQRIDLEGGRYEVSDALPDGNRYVALGSGASFVLPKIPRSSDAHSRDIFKVLVDVMRAPSPRDVGGSPQAVALFTRRLQPHVSGSQVSGFNWRVDDRYESTLFGVPLHFASDMSPVLFRTESFARTRYLRAARLRRFNW